MNEPLLKPRSAYESAVKDRVSIAEREAAALTQELLAHKNELDDHDYKVERSGNVVAVKRGPLNIVSVTFNADDTGRHRVINGVAEHLRQGLTVDFDDPTVAKFEFKAQLRHATDLFYANKSQFESLRLT